MLCEPSLLFTLVLFEIERDAVDAVARVSWELVRLAQKTPAHRSSVGVLKPSPLNTCLVVSMTLCGSVFNTHPRWPPQFAHMISIRLMNIDRSSLRMTAPGTVS